MEGGGDGAAEKVLAYAMAKDHGKVGPTLTWLVDSGFVLISVFGGEDEPFGNLELVFRRGETVVRIGYDRAWELSLGLGEARYGLGTYLGVMNGTEVGEITDIDDVFPPIAWHEVPRVVEWLESGDRGEALREHSEKLRAAWLRYNDRPLPPGPSAEELARRARRVRDERLRFAARMFGLAVATVVLDRVTRRPGGDGTGR